MGQRGGTRAVAQEERRLSTESAFDQAFGGRPDGLWCAPGRVNLIGEHTDYNEGFVLPLAVDLECVVGGRRREDDRLRLVSRQLGDGGTISLSDRRTEQVAPWARYVAGTAWALQDAGLPVGGADLLVDSAVPVGAGLSSSAALECSTGLALCELAGLRPDPVVLARAGQTAEGTTVGAPVGVMDQMAAVMGAEHGPLLLDCRTLDHRSVPLPLSEHDLALLVVDTRVVHSHASGAYAERRRECEQAAELLGRSFLRDATEQDLSSGVLSGALLRRARHVVTENARVLAAAAALEGGDLSALGPLFAASHQSLREDFEVSCPELDLAVGSAVSAGALAARMTGGGFGGSVVVLARTALVPELEVTCVTAAHQAGAPTPVVRAVLPGLGARRCD